MSEIIPAILPKSFEELEDRLADVRGLLELVQIDVCNGTLTPARTWPYQSANKSDLDFEEIASEVRAMPFWEDVEFEAHLMMAEPENFISDWISAGATRIIVQIEGAGNVERCVEEVAGRVPLGVSIALDTPLEIFKSIAKDISIIQCMGWNFSNLGRQAVPLDPAVYARIAELRKLYPELVLSIDGGVDLVNVPQLLLAGVDRMVVGSAFWQGGAVRENLAKFKSLSKF